LVGGGETLTISGVVSGTGNPTMLSPGTVRFTNDANSYDNLTRIANGTTEFTSIKNIGVNSAAGASSAGEVVDFIIGSASTIGTLSYTGAGDSTDRQLRIGNTNAAAASGGATIENNGTGALIWTATAFNVPDTGGNGTTQYVDARTLTLGGTNMDANEIQGVIADNNGAAHASLDNTVSLVKADAGMWTLSGANTYTGGTTVSGGTLVVNNTTGSGTGTGNVTVNVNGTLAGNGTIAGATTISGTHAPGDPAVNSGVGTQTFGSTLDYTNGANVEWELLSSTTAGPGTNYDQIAVGGNLTFTGATTFDLIFNTGTVNFNDSFWNSDQMWAIYTGVTNTPDLMGLVATPTVDGSSNVFGTTGGTVYGAFSFAKSGSDIKLLYTVTVPEPTSLAMLGLGLMGIGGRRRRKVKQA
jgi:fibronectin-binding autotransporter adhesin